MSYSIIYYGYYVFQKIQSSFHWKYKSCLITCFVLVSSLLGFLVSSFVDFFVSWCLGFMGFFIPSFLHVCVSSLLRFFFSISQTFKMDESPKFNISKSKCTIFQNATFQNANFIISKICRFAHLDSHFPNSEFQNMFKRIVVFSWKVKVIWYILIHK